MGALLVMLTLVGLVVLPGLIWHRALLSERGLSPLTAVSLLLAALVILFSGVAALFGYRLWLMASLNAALALIGVVIWRVRRSRLTPFRDWLASLSLSTPDALYFAFIGAVFIAPAFVLVVPFDTDAQGFGYLALTVKRGGTIDTLAPFYPDVRYLYSPAFFILTAYLSDLLGLPLHEVMLGLSHSLAALGALLAFDLGRAFRDRRFGLLLALTITAGLGLFTTVMDSAYTAVLAFLFVELFLILLWRVMKRPTVFDVALAAVALAAVPLSHPDTILILLIGYLPFYATSWLSREMEWPRFRRMALIIPIIGLALTLPWLARVLPLFFEGQIGSPFLVTLRHWQQLILFNGVLVPLLAVWGAIIAIRRRSLSDVWMLTWLVAVVDFGLFGLVGAAGMLLGLDLMQYVYPFSIAWRGPILPFAYLSAVALGDLSSRIPALSAVNWPRLRLAGSIIGLALVFGGLVASRPLIRLSKPWLSIYGGFSSRADVTALRWVQRNTPPDSRLFNYPVGVEGHWAPVIAERDAVSFRHQHFFSHQPTILQAQLTPENEITVVYHDLASPDAERWLCEHGVDYVFIPQVIADPASFSTLQRWNPPQTLPFASTPAEANYLHLVYEVEGAQIYRAEWAGD